MYWFSIGNFNLVCRNKHENFSHNSPPLWYTNKTIRNVICVRQIKVIRFRLNSQWVLKWKFSFSARNKKKTMTENMYFDTSILLWLHISDCIFNRIASSVSMWSASQLSCGKMKTMQTRHNIQLYQTENADSYIP